MVASVLNGQVEWSMDRDEDGHRSYTISHYIITTTGADGPSTAANAPGLPLPGSIWNFDNDVDPWAFCTPKLTVRVHEKVKKGHPAKIWKVTNYFSTLPLRRCQDTTIEDPLLEPDRLSGSFVKYVREITQDKDGNPIKTSSHELIRGAQAEFDANRPTVVIEQNRSNLELDVFSQMIDTLNDAPLWGLPVRTIKLSNVPWSRKVYGTCGFYYTRSLEFDVMYNTFDRTAIDEGTKVLHGHWTDSGWTLDNISGSPPDKTNPQHFDVFKDRNGENGRVILDGNGEPATDPNNPGTINIQGYTESNFLLLGVPTTLA